MPVRTLTARTAAVVAALAVCASACVGTTSRSPDAARASGVSLRPVDGGPDYYARFADALPTDPAFFPVAVWFDGVASRTDTDADQALGLNTYVLLTDNSDLGAVRAAGMHAILAWRPGAGDAAGYFLADEADMWAGPGDAAWTGHLPGQGDPCSPQEARCGYTVQRTLLDSAPADKLLMANFGKGVTFWETDREAARFVSGPDVVSADNYWFTDTNICGMGEGSLLLGRRHALAAEECRRAANYGRTVDRVRSLVRPRGSKPVWAFVEVGHPSSESSAPTITPAQVRAAVWSSIIHGARGIVYFNHSFGGSCVSADVLRDPCGDAVRPMVTRVDATIRRLAPVLNAPFVDGLVTTHDGVDVAVKLYDGHFYVLAGSTRPGDRTVTLEFACGDPRSAEVLDEHRSVPIRDGHLQDGFAGADAVHLYRVDGGDTCRLR